jgi:hypothetical protein
MWKTGVSTTLKIRRKLLFYAENGDNSFLRNVGHHLPEYAALYSSTYFSVYCRCYVTTVRWAVIPDPFLGNCSANTFPRQRERDVSAWSLLRCYKQGIKLAESQFYTGLEHRSRGIAIVRSRCQETSSKDTAGWIKLSVAVVICKVRKSATVL